MVVIDYFIIRKIIEIKKSKTKNEGNIKNKKDYRIFDKILNCYSKQFVISGHSLALWLSFLLLISRKEFLKKRSRYLSHCFNFRS